MCKEGGDVRAYVVTPTDDKFLLPVDDGFDFADDDHDKKRGREPSGAADDPICLEGDEGAAEDDLFARKKKKKKVGALCGKSKLYGVAVPLPHRAMEPARPGPVDLHTGRDNHRRR